MNIDPLTLLCCNASTQLCCAVCRTSVYISLDTHYATPLPNEIFFLFYNNSTKKTLSIVGWKTLNLSVPTYTQYTCSMFSNTYWNRTACRLCFVPDCKIFFFFSPSLHTIQFVSEFSTALLLVVRAPLRKNNISCIELIFIIFYVLLLGPRRETDELFSLYRVEYIKKGEKFYWRIVNKRRKN
jgi:hypothetical protein